MKAKYIFIVLFELVWFGSYAAARDDAVNLSSLIKTARERNPEIKAAREMWQSKVFLIVPAGTAPDLNLGFMWENMEPGENSLSGAGMEMLSLSQKYPFFGKLSIRSKIARSESEIYGYLYQDIARCVISSLKKAYYDVSYYQKAIEIYEEMSEILKHDSRVAEQKYRAGKEKQMNVLKAQVELARILDEILTLKNKKYTAQVAINVLLDYPAARPLGRVETPEHEEFDFERELIAQAVLLHSPALKAVFAAKEKADKLTALARMGYLPDFMFTYKRRYMPEGFSGWDFGLNVNLPLYFWKQRGDIKSQTANASAMENNYKNMENKIIYSMEHVLTQIDTYSRLYDLYKTNFIPQAEQAWKVAQIGYRAGQVDFIDLLDAERSYLSFQIKFWKYCTEYKKYLAELEQIAGKDISELKEEK